MPLAHFTNIDAHTNSALGNEPVHKNLFETTIILPTILQAIHPNATHMLLENTTNATFPVYPDLPKITQRFKYSTRKYLGMPDDTSQEFDIQFNMNATAEYQVYCFRMIKDWYDLSWNNEDGSLHYKKNCIGDIIIHNHDKEGHVIRRVTYHDCMVSKIAGWDALDWGANSEVFSLTASFVADYWEDFYY